MIHIPLYNIKEEKDMIMNRFIFLLCIFSCFCMSQQIQKRTIILDDIFHPELKKDFEGNPPYPFTWLPDGEHVLIWNQQKQEWTSIHAISRELSTVYSYEQFEEACVSSELPHIIQDKMSISSDILWNPQFTGFVFFYKQGIYYCDILKNIISRLTQHEITAQELSFSPDGKWLSFIRFYDLYIVSVETKKEIRCTVGGNEKLHNGYLDWVYQEELYGRGNFKGYWWSPDSASIAFFQMDLSNVDTFRIVDHSKIEYSDISLGYPKAGRPNAHVKLGIFELGSHSIQWVPVQDNEKESLLFVDVSWSPNSEHLCFQVQNRQQTWLELYIFEMVDRTTHRILQETTPAWVETYGSPIWTANNTFLWRNVRTGWNHIYEYKYNGTQWNFLPVTAGKWDVREMYGTHQNFIFYSSNQENPLELHVYCLDTITKQTKKLTTQPGHHNAKFNPQKTMFLDTWSNIYTPPHIDLKTSKGEWICQFHTPQLDTFQEINLQPIEFQTIPNRNGFLMPAMFIYPNHFKLEQKYPILFYVYGAPQISQVRNKWPRSDRLWHHVLASKGYIICYLDNQTATNYGAAPSWKAYKKLGQTEVQDIEDAVQWLKQKTYIDEKRIGIWGWSYGGYFTTYALTTTKLFKMGIAVAPVTDWRHYDTIYTERFMNTPQNNPLGYQKSSAVRNASNLHGKFLLIHGTMDDNVHLQNSVQLIYALQRAGKQFDFMIYPKCCHSIKIPILRYHLYKTMTDYVLKNL